MKVTYPIRTDNGDEYLILIESFEKTVFPEEIISALGSIEIMDITLERLSGSQTTNLNVLFDISSFIAGFLNDNENVILYFYCDDMHEISRRNRSVTAQKFRSALFSKMFDRYIKSRNITGFFNTPLEIKADRDIYIHLISREEHCYLVEIIKNAIIGLASK